MTDPQYVRCGSVAGAWLTIPLGGSDFSPNAKTLTDCLPRRPDNRARVATDSTMAFESPVDTDTKMDMAALGHALRRRWLRILLVTAVLVGGAYALLLFVPKSYDSTASILVENRDSVYTQPASTGPGTQGPAVSPAPTISSQIEPVK